jgi:hypothetical protein
MAEVFVQKGGNMTPERQRIAIAEICGITEIVRKNRHEYGGLVGRFPDGDVKIIPSYCRDLNAMNEAEKTLTDAQWLAWEHIAAFMSTPRGSMTLTIWIAKMNAAQRAEAFLRTLGKWEEETP